MTDYEKFPGAVLCANCGLQFAEHLTANYADGPLVGVRFEVCPKSVFRDPRPHASPGQLVPPDARTTRFWNGLGLEPPGGKNTTGE